MALVVTTFLWGHYGEHYVRRLASAVHRNLNEAHRFICFTDTRRHLPEIEQHQIRDMELTRVKGCFARLRLFDPQWQHKLGIHRRDRIVNLDLDLVVTGTLDPLFNAGPYNSADFTILQGINSKNPCPYNGSVWMLRGGARADVWDDFSLDAAAKIPFDTFPDDQGWFAAMMPNAASWGPAQGVYGFQKVGWPKGDALPEGARIVAFPGWRDPQKFEHLDWVKEHWR